MHILEKMGYTCTKAGGSLGLFDVIGINSQETVCIQVKTRDWPGSAEMEQLQMFRKHPHCRVMVHRWLDRRMLPDVKEVR